jgi:hypothetical protein
MVSWRSKWVRSVMVDLGLGYGLGVAIEERDGRKAFEALLIVARLATLI